MAEKEQEHRHQFINNKLIEFKENSQKEYHLSLQSMKYAFYFALLCLAVTVLFALLGYGIAATLTLLTTMGSIVGIFILKQKLSPPPSVKPDTSEEKEQE